MSTNEKGAFQELEERVHTLETDNKIKEITAGLLRETEGTTRLTKSVILVGAVIVLLYSLSAVSIFMSLRDLEERVELLEMQVDGVLEDPSGLGFGFARVKNSNGERGSCPQGL